MPKTARQSILMFYHDEAEPLAAENHRVNQIMIFDIHVLAVLVGKVTQEKAQEI